MKTLIDSSGWIQYFTAGRLADKYAVYIKNLKTIRTPTIVLYEVYKIIKREKGEESALLIAGQIGKTTVIPLSDSIALAAADISLQYRLAMADAIVYATAQEEGAELITSDADLQGLPGVVYLPPK